MIVLYVLLVMAGLASGSRDLEKVSDKSKYSDKLDSNFTNLILAHCSELEVHSLKHNWYTLVAYNCGSGFNLAYPTPIDNLFVVRLENSTILELHQLPKIINLITLELRGNSIGGLCNETFHHLSNLRFLFLEDNLIEVLPERVFYPLKNLLMLDLSNNKISVLTKNLFSRNALLLKLNLKGNPLTSVAFPIGWPDSAISIDLSNCSQLRHMRVSIDVKILNLENSGLERLQFKGRIGERINHGSSKLNYAHFHDTILNGTEFKSILCGLPALKRLDLSKTSINTSFFNFDGLYENNCSLPSLRFLNLSDNKLEYIPRMSPLVGLNLTTLDLSHNLLEVVSLESLAAAQSLQRLYLEGNRLTSFDYQSVCDGLKNLKKLALFDNLFNATFYDEMTKYYNNTKLHLIQKEKRIIETEDRAPTENVKRLILNILKIFPFNSINFGS